MSSSRCVRWSVLHKTNPSDQDPRVCKKPTKYKPGDHSKWQTPGEKTYILSCPVVTLGSKSELMVKLESQLEALIVVRMLISSRDIMRWHYLTPHSSAHWSPDNSCFSILVLVFFCAECVFWKRDGNRELPITMQGCVCTLTSSCIKPAPAFSTNCNDCS